MELESGNSMTKSQLDNFGRAYINDVRDDAIQHWSDIISGNIKAPELIALGNEINNNSKESIQLLSRLIPRIIDSCISRNLRFFEQHPEFEILAGDSNLVDLSDGLTGELFGRRGWISKFSKAPPDDSQ
jgi:hypothetical protein